MSQNLNIFFLLSSLSLVSNIEAQEKFCPSTSTSQVTAQDPIFTYAIKRREANRSLTELVNIIDRDGIRFSNRDGSETVYIHPKLQAWYEATLKKLNEDDEFARHFMNLRMEIPEYVNGEAGYSAHPRYSPYAPDSLNADFSAAIESLYALKERRSERPSEPFAQSSLAVSLKYMQRQFGSYALMDSDVFRNIVVIKAEEGSASSAPDSDSVDLRVVTPGSMGMKTLDLQVSSAYLSDPNARLMDHVKSIGVIRYAPKDFNPPEDNMFMPHEFELTKSVKGVLHKRKGLGGLDYESTGESVEIPAGTQVYVTHGRDWSKNYFRYDLTQYLDEDQKIEGSVNLVEQHLARKGLLAK